MPVRSPALPIAALLAATLLLPPSALAQSRAPNLLITPAELARVLTRGELVLLQVGPREDYDAGHIPGARFVEMKDIAAPPSEGAPQLELPSPEQLKAALERLGIGDGSKVVVVPGADWGSPATRVMWTLQVAGLGTRSQLLDGGSNGWKAAGLPMTKDAPPAATPGHLTVAQDRSLVVDFDWLRRALPPRGFTLVDARAPMFYEGPGMSDGRGMRHEAGHIPGAHNLPFNTLFDDNVKMLPLDDLRARFEAAGIHDGDQIVAYCHLGQQATMVVFAARLLGHQVRLYDGSFNDWEARKGPIENATAPARSPQR